MPKVSIIVPVYNVEKYLPKCLESLINQTFKDIEIICVNDSSSDSSLDILNSYASKDSRLVVINKKNEGPGVARNTALKIAQGEYIAFVDGDDCFDVSLIEKCIAKAENYNTDAVIFGAYNLYDTDCVNGGYSVNKIPANLKGKPLSQNEIRKNIFKFPPTAWCKFYKKDFLTQNNIIFSDDYKGEDQLFFIGAMIFAKSIYVINENLYLYRKNRRDSLTFSKKKHENSIISNFNSISRLLENQSLEDEFVFKILDKYFMKAVSWLGKCEDFYKPPYYTDLTNLIESVAAKYPKFYWKNLNINAKDSYFVLKLKLLLARLIKEKN